MRQVPYDELARALAGSSLPGDGDKVFGIPQSSGFFVDPTLVVKEDAGDLSSSVILVSARGASGKSRTASDLAARIGAPLWLLEDDEAVGGSSLPMRLTRYLAAVDPLSSLDRLPYRPAVLIDSLDEARARVSGDSWADFLRFVVAAADRNLCIVLFGREQALTDVYLELDDIGRSVAWLEISHLPTDAQHDYIDHKVRAIEPTMDVNGVNYREARKALLDALAGALDTESAEMFVGYPPVLDAVATSLASDPLHHKVVQEFSSRASGFRHLEVLRKILGDLLTREQGKMGPLARELGLDATTMFGADEQLQWLWRDLTGGDEPDLSHISNPERREEYRERIRPFVQDHPFRTPSRWASTVFEAYAATERSGAGLPSSTLYTVGTHSGLLFDFTAALQSECETVLDEWEFAALHASLLAGGSAGSETAVSLVDVGDGLVGSMEVNRAHGVVKLEFLLITDNEDVLRLNGPLESLTVSTEGCVVVPSLGNRRIIGPDLFLRCGSLRIQGDEARFARTSSGTTVDVRFEVTGPEVSLTPFISVAPSPGSFELVVEDPALIGHPWFEYLAELETDDGVDVHSDAIRFLNKLQNLARKHGHKGPRATFYMKLQGRQFLRTERFRAVLAVLERMGVVQVKGELVFITPEADGHRFSGKAIQGQRTIHDEWDYWGPIVEEMDRVLKSA